jgi:hypothetical protein
MTIILSGANGETPAQWTTSGRPATPNTGQYGYNTTLNALEYYNGSSWVGSNGLLTAAVQTSNFTAVAGYIYPVNTTSGAITVTLPASPVAGNQITIVDYAGTFATNNCTVSPNGNNLQGYTNSAILNTKGQATNLVYVDSTKGWIQYSASTSQVFQPYSISWLIAAGGGGGGGSNNTKNEAPGGGGAGGLGTASSINITPGTVLTITVGAGGAGGGQPGSGSTGSNSVLSFGAITETAYGGGGGADFVSNFAGGSGGSGGGETGTATKGAGTYSTFLGNAGGSNSTTGNGGGGGAGSVGGNASGTTGGNGGSGSASSITGSSVTYAGGGGGGGGKSGGAGGSGGSGGGGAGGGQGSNGTAGTVNTGGGGGASGASSNNGGSGGSGVVILSVPTANYSGTTTGSPTVTTSGSNKILTFTSSGTYTA